MNNPGRTREVSILLTAFLLIVLMLFVNAQGATVIKGSDAFGLTKKTYGIGDIIEGFVNISISNQSSNGNFKLIIGDYEQNISIFDFLIKAGLKAGKDFSCNPKDCNETYETVGSSIRTKKIGSGSTLIGAMIIGRDIDFKTNVLEFDVNGYNTTSSCGVSPLRLDIFADKKTDMQYVESGDLCGSVLPSPCYDDSSADKNFDITTTGYCENIFLPISNKFKLAALLKKNKGGGDLSMFLYDKKTGNSESCDLPEPNETTGYMQTGCIVDFPVLDYADEQEYYVCIKDDITDNGYTVKGEISGELCGTVGLPQGNESADFALFVQPSSILPFNRTMTFNETEFERINVNSLSQYIQNYITERYEGDCIPDCIIPIEIDSEQEVTVSNFSVSYCTQGLCTTEDKFFILTKEPAVISMNMTSLPLEAANFTSHGIGNQTLKAYLDDTLIGSEQILVERVPIIRSILNIGTEAMAPIQFIVDAYSPKNNSLISYKWDFGDGKTETTTSNSTRHTYGNVGKFKVKVEVTDSEGLTGTKTKEIGIGSPRDIVNKTIASKKATINNITSQIDSMGWYKETVKKQIGIQELNDRLSEYERRYKIATLDAEYLDIMAKLNELKVPQLIYDSESISDFPLVIDINSIMPEYIEKLGGGAYDTNYAEETKEVIGAWQSENLQISASGKVISTQKEDNSTQNIVTVINMKIAPNEQKSELFFVILLPYEKMAFASEYGQQQLDGAVGFVFKDITQQTLSLALLGKVNFEEIVAFGSPYMGDLPPVNITIVCNNNGKCEQGENWKNCRSDCKPIGMAIFYIFLIIALMYCVYLFMKRWYKTKYENFLFKNRQDLNNILFFIRNSLGKGKEEKEVIEELKKAGWGGEQIEYAIRKVKGKPIGMPEMRIKIKGIKLIKKKESTQSIPKA